MNKLTIAASGLDGLIGSRVQELLSNKFNFIDLNMHIMDITNKNQVDNVVSIHDFDIFLHLAAYTNVDEAEENRDLAKKINVEGTKNIFDIVKKMNKKMIYISTGFVFDGNNPPYYEDSQPNPLSYYAQTKYMGEKIVKNHAMIVRLDYPYGGQVSYKKDIVKSIIDELKKRNEIKGITDQVFTPTFIDDIAHALEYLFQHFSPEIYHIVGSDSLNGYEIISTIGKIFSIDYSFVKKTTYDEFYKNRALRPKKSIIKSKKNTFYTMKTFIEGLESLRSNSSFLDR